MIDKVLKSGLARPKTVAIFSFGGNPVFGTGCYITVYPTQTWEFKTHETYVELYRQKLHIAMSIRKEDFERAWLVKKWTIEKEEN